MEHKSKKRVKAPKQNLPPDQGPYDQYHGTWLRATECAALYDLERLLGCPVADVIRDIEKDRYAFVDEGEGPWGDIDFGFVQHGRRPGRLGEPFVQVLGLMRRGLRELPDSIGNFSRLERLLLENNQLKVLPDTIGNLTHLQWLSLSDNPLEALPAAIGNLQELKSLRLSSAKLSTLPENICTCHALEYLELWKTPLISLPSEIGNLRALRKFQTDSDFLEELPYSIGGLEKLTSLILNTPKLITLPESIQGLGSLKYLCIGNSWGTSGLKTKWQASNFTFPHEIKQILSLEKLSLPEAVLERNAKIIQEIPNIRSLELQITSWLDLPPFILEMPSLKSIIVLDVGDIFKMGTVAHKFVANGGFVQKMNQAVFILETLGPGLNKHWIIGNHSS